MPESFFNNVAGLRTPVNNFIKRETPALVFSCKFANILSKNTLKNTNRRFFSSYCEIFMTTNFSFSNYDVVNSFNILIKRIFIERPPYFLSFWITTPDFLFFFFFSYIVSCIIIHIYWFIFIYVVYTYFVLIKKTNNI